MTGKTFILKTVQDHLSRTLPCSIYCSGDSVYIKIFALNSTCHVATVEVEEIFTKPYATNFIYDQASQVLLDEIEFTLRMLDNLSIVNLVEMMESYLGIVIDYSCDGRVYINLRWSFPDSEVYQCSLPLDMLDAYQRKSLLTDAIIESLSYNFEKEKP